MCFLKILYFEMWGDVIYAMVVNVSEEPAASIFSL
jgi:hypothetical protein